MVSEFDLLLKEERDLRGLGAGLPARSRRERKRAEGRTAAALMTSPAITIHPDAPVGVAARLMNGHHIGGCLSSIRRKQRYGGSAWSIRSVGITKIFSSSAPAGLAVAPVTFTSAPLLSSASTRACPL